MAAAVLESSIVEYVDVTFPANATVSEEAFLGGSTICGVYIPSGISATTIGFYASSDQASYVEVKTNAASNFLISIVPNSYLPIAPADLVGINFFKIFIDVAQSTSSIFKVVSRKIQ